MNCPYCNKEISEDALFCTECGRELQKGKKDTVFCPTCGEQLSSNVVFCTNCGARIIEHPETATGTKLSTQPKTVSTGVSNDSAALNNRVNETYNAASSAVKKDQGKEPLYIVITILSAVLVFVLFRFVIFHKKDSGEENYAQTENYVQTTESGRIEDTTEGQVMQEPDQDMTEDMAEEAVDYDFTKVQRASVEGYIKEGGGNTYVIQLDREYSVYIEEKDTSETVLLSVSCIDVDESKLPDGFLEEAVGKEVTVEGNVYAASGNIWLIAEQCLDEAGNDLAAAFQKKQGLQADYILPQSDSVRLTEKDIKDLSLQELNYAKNEIYARHGRKFDSKELREYFESKAWYKGTIDPENFNENTLNKVERANVILIRDREYSIDPNGYPLDQ